MGAVIASLTAVVPATPAVAAPPTAPYTAFTMAGRWDVAGTPDTSTLSFTWFDDRGFDVNMRTPDGESYFARISAPYGKTLSLGTYPARGSGDTDNAMMFLSGPGTGCSDTVGSITITEVTRDTETNAITALALSYEETNCLSLKGEIRFNSSKGYSAGVSNSRVLGYGTVNAGDTSPAQTFTVRSLGSKDLWFGAGALAGVNPTHYKVVSDTCSGKTLAYDQTCSVSIAASPRSIGELPATFELPSNTMGGKEVFWLISAGTKSNKGTFYPLTPSRILDTREGNGAPVRPVGQGASIDLQVTGRGNVPASGVAAVVLNVTVVQPTSWGHVTVWPTGVARPVASSLNFTPGWVGANSVTVAVGAGGKVSLYNSAGNTHLLADVVGWYADASVIPDWATRGGLLHSITPQRRLDTRTWGYGKLGHGDAALLFANFGAEANAHIKAWVVNVTSTEAETPGYLTAWDGNEYNLPLASTLNLAPGQTVPNLAVVPARRCWECTGNLYGVPMIGVYSAGVSHVIVDMFAVFDDGWDTDGLRLDPMTPTRIVDSRSNLGTSGALGQAATATITTPSGLVNADTYGLALNVTAVSPTVNTFVTVWPNGISRPVVSNLNPSTGQIVPNAVVTGLDPSYRFNVYNNGGSVHFVVDVVGRFYWYPYGSLTAARAAGATGDIALSPDNAKALKR